MLWKKNKSKIMNYFYYLNKYKFENIFKKITFFIVNNNTFFNNIQYNNNNINTINYINLFLLFLFFMWFINKEMKKVIISKYKFNHKYIVK